MLVELFRGVGSLIVRWYCTYIASQHTLFVVEWFDWTHFGVLQQRNDVAAVTYVSIGIANAGRHASLSRDQGKIHPIRANREAWSYHSLVIACTSYHVVTRSIFNHLFCICSHLSKPVCNTGNKIKAPFMDLAMIEKDIQVKVGHGAHRDRASSLPHPTKKNLKTIEEKA